MLLEVDRITKAYGDSQVLDGVSLHLEMGQKVGLVGANGIGKSTLLRIIVGEESADTGSVFVAEGSEVGYLPQMLHGADSLTVEQLLNRALGGLRDLEARMRDLERAMARGDTRIESIVAAYGNIAEQFEARGGYELEHRRTEIFAGLALDHIQPSRAVADLSGGEKSRVGLASILLCAPDLLILDEPTNHLDFWALDWLESYLSRFRGGVLAVSHDRDFLNHTVSAIVEIDEQTRQGRHFAGSYDFYAEQRELQRLQWEQAYLAQQEEIKVLQQYLKGRARQVAHNRVPHDGDKFAYTHKGERVQDAISRNLRTADEKLRRIEENPVPRPPRSLEINTDFDAQELVGRTPMDVAGLGKAYGTRLLFQDLSFSVGHGDRIVIIGDNGAGKSTLMRILAGLEQADAGTVTVATGVVRGYLDQEQEQLDQSATVMQIYRADRIADPEEIKAELLKYHLFTYPELAKCVGVLSVGQKRKLQIAGLIAARADLLLLDEPTNHISLDVLEEFETALLAFSGPIIAISHDRRFNRRFANQVWLLNDGRLMRFLGTWDEWRAHQEAFIC